MTWPQARVTIVCGPLAASLFEGYPLCERIIPLKKQPYNRHWLALWWQVVGTRWDGVIDLRNSAVSRLIVARRRFVFGSHIDAQAHKVYQNAQVMRVSPPPAPKLWFTAEQRRKAETFIPDEGGLVLAVGPTAHWIGKTWPVGRFIETVQWTIRAGGVMEGARVAVFSAPGEEPAARQLLDSLPPERRIDLIARTDPATSAAVLARCDFYLGNDSGLMHCASAVGIPTLGLFGPSYPALYAPWGSHARFVSTPESFDQLTAYEGYDPKTLTHSLMESLTVEAVEEAIEAMWVKPSGL